MAASLSVSLAVLARPAFSQAVRNGAPAHPPDTSSSLGAFAVVSVGVAMTRTDLQNRAGGTAELVAGFHPRRVMRLPLAVAAIAGVHGYLGEDCVVRVMPSGAAPGGCEPSMPSNHFIGVIAGPEVRRKFTTATLFVGPAAIRTYSHSRFDPAGGTVFALALHAGVSARIPATRVALALSAHSLFAPNFPGGSANLLGVTVGLRIQ